MLPEITPPPRANLWVGTEWAPFANAVVTWTANQARLMAFQVDRSVTVETAYFRTAVSNGNVDAGIYDDAGNRLASSGSVATPTAGGSSVALTAALTLHPGVRYWAAIALDNSTATVGVAPNNTLSSIPGYIKQGAVAASFPLPATIVIPTVEVSALVSLQFA